LRNKSRLLFKKGVIEVISYLHKVGKAGYYEIYKQNFVVSRQTFANLLKELKDMGLVSRKVIDGRPPRVKYSLTEKGKEIARILDELDEILQK
jgi:DNA-binding HxlR family transcriptional regulator